jgi:plasmid stability protein
MAAIQVRNVDASVLRALKKRAARHHRSLEGEVRQILTDATTAIEVAPPPRSITLVTVRTGNSRPFSRDDLGDGD